jgi:hypothetical protein
LLIYNVAFLNESGLFSRPQKGLETLQNGPIYCMVQQCIDCADFGLIRAIWEVIVSSRFFRDMYSSRSINRQSCVTGVWKIGSEPRTRRFWAGRFVSMAETVEAFNLGAGVSVLDASPGEIIS